MAFSHFDPLIKRLFLASTCHSRSAISHFNSRCASSATLQRWTRTEYHSSSPDVYPAWYHSLVLWRFRFIIMTLLRREIQWSEVLGISNSKRKKAVRYHQDAKISLDAYQTIHKGKLSVVWSLLKALILTISSKESMVCWKESNDCELPYQAFGDERLHWPKRLVGNSFYPIRPVSQHRPRRPTRSWKGLHTNEKIGKGNTLY